MGRPDPFSETFARNIPAKQNHQARKSPKLATLGKAGENVIELVVGAVSSEGEAIRRRSPSAAPDAFALGREQDALRIETMQRVVERDRGLTWER